jgi:hypothetical protein
VDRREGEVRRFIIALLVGCGGSTDAPPASATDSEVVVTDSLTVEDTGTVVADSAEPPMDSGTVVMDAPVTETGIVFGPYPAGPYGNKLGDVLSNFAWEGFVNPTADGVANTKPYVTTDLDKLRRDAKKGYALIHVSEFG